MPDLIIKNPQIKSIALFHLESEFLQMINTHLPQLDTLALRLDREVNERIQFENVTKVVFEYPCSPVNLHFPRLQVAHIHRIDWHYDEYRDFLNEHNQLTHLYISHFTIEDSHFQQLTANQPNLVEITLDSMHLNGFYSAVIVEFLRNNTNVKQLNLIGYCVDRHAELQEKLKNHWNIKINRRDVYLTRKTEDQL